MTQSKVLNVGGNHGRGVEPLVYQRQTRAQNHPDYDSAAGGRFSDGLRLFIQPTQEELT